MPTTLKQLAVVHFFTWLGIFCVFLYFPPAVAYRIFGAAQQNSQMYTYGIEWAGICIAVYNGVCLIFSWLLTKLTEITNHKIAHSLCLICGGAGLISLIFVDQPLLAFLPMVGFGIAWSSILAIPYSILSKTLTGQNKGLYMGIFNTFIVLPQIFAALGLGWMIKVFFDSNRLLAVVFGGFSLCLAASS